MGIYSAYFYIKMADFLNFVKIISLIFWSNSLEIVWFSLYILRLLKNIIS